MSIRIVTDSACDLTQEQAKQMNIEILPLKVRFGEEEFLDTIDLSHDEFFVKLEQSGIFPQTSQITPFEYEEVFQSAKDNGDQVVCITLSSKLSGCFQSALSAGQDFEDVAFIVDSLNACIGQRILVELAVRLREEGKSAKEIQEELDIQKLNIRLVALVDTLEYLKKGGRVSAAVAFVGNVLSVKPVIAIEDGEVHVLGKARGSKKGNNLLTEHINTCGGIDFDMPYCLGYSGLSDAMLKQYVADFEDIYLSHCSAEELPISSIGCAIGTHAGPNAIAVTFFKK